MCGVHHPTLERTPRRCTQFYVSSAFPTYFRASTAAGSKVLFFDFRSNCRVYKNFNCSLASCAWRTRSGREKLWPAAGVVTCMYLCIHAWMYVCSVYALILCYRRCITTSVQPCHTVAASECVYVCVHVCVCKIYYVYHFVCMHESNVVAYGTETAPHTQSGREVHIVLAVLAQPSRCWRRSMCILPTRRRRWRGKLDIHSSLSAIDGLT